MHLTTRSFAANAFPRKELRRALVLLGALAVWGRCALALDPDRAITQYVHESWVARDGAPSGTITAIAQTTDGYLWLGTESEGLVRFDGVAFGRSDELDVLFGRRIDQITSLLCGRNGALWVGTTYGLARRMAGHWMAFDRGDGDRHLWGLHEAPDGAVWYGRHWEGVYTVSGETLKQLPLAGRPRFITTDTQGAMWVGGYEGLWRFAGKEWRRYSKQDGLKDANITCIYGDRAGDVWAGLAVGLTRLRDGKIVAHYTTRDGLSDNEISAIYMDRDGVLWVGTAGGGLNRRRGARFESLTKTLGFTNSRVTAIREDREGALWVGTAGGLNRLRDASLVPIGKTEGLSGGEALAIVEGRDGSAFVASGFGGIAQIKDGHIRIFPPESVPGSHFSGPLFAGPDGGIWSGEQDGLSYRRDGRGTFYPVKGQVTCVSHDARSIVFAISSGEVFRLVGGKPERYRLADGSLLGPETLQSVYVWMMYLARDGTFWLATSRGVIAVRNGQARRVWSVFARAARSISEDEDGTLWVGTHAGVVRIAGESLATFTAKEGLPYEDICHVLSDRRGGIWMSSARGIYRVERRKLEEVAQGKARTFDVEVFGVSDGLRTSVAARYQPVGCATRDGRLWFTTTEGIVAIDPARIRRNRLPPPVLVEGVVADDRPLGVAMQMRLPATTERLAIHYNGLSLLMPQRVRFKYKLEGYDRDWVDAGTRRVAYYTKLPPGFYGFHVVAANNDGVWNDVGAVLNIRKLAHFYETVWFYAAVVLVLVAATVSAYRLRVRRHVRAERELQQCVTAALAQVKTLSGMLPLCAWCKKVRDDSGYWNQIEVYVSQHTQAEFSHGICPDCREKMRPRGAGAPPPA